jgi:hypothetical protein
MVVELEPWDLGPCLATEFVETANRASPLQAGRLATGLTPRALAWQPVSSHLAAARACSKPGDSQRDSPLVPWLGSRSPPIWQPREPAASRATRNGTHPSCPGLAAGLLPSGSRASLQQAGRLATGLTPRALAWQPDTSHLPTARARCKPGDSRRNPTLVPRSWRAGEERATR